MSTIFRSTGFSGLQPPSLMRAPSDRSGQRWVGYGLMGRMWVTGDEVLPVGTFSLTLTNVVVGSAIQVESQDGTTVLYNGTAATSSPTINLSAYASGSNLNALRVKVRKGTSSPYYQPWETLTIASVGSQSIYVAQIPDE